MPLPSGQDAWGGGLSLGQVPEEEVEVDKSPLLRAGAVDSAMAGCPDVELQHVQQHPLGVPHGHPAVRDGEAASCPFQMMALVANARAAGNVPPSQTSDATTRLQVRQGAKKVAPRKGVLLHTPSMNSQAYAQSVVDGTTAALLGQSLLSGGLDSMGLGKLKRKEWSHEEKQQRGTVLPVLKQTIKQLDGTLDPKHKLSAAGKRSPEENISAFGHAFYTELFSKYPDLHSSLFGSKPTDLLAMKLGNILADIVRLLELPSPTALAASVAEMALRHIEYGLEDHHVEPFKATLMLSLKRVVQDRGFRWTSRASMAWNWALGEIIGLLMEAVNMGRPKVEKLNESWMFICEQLCEEECAKKERHNKFSKGLRSGMSVWSNMGSRIGSQFDGKLLREGSAKGRAGHAGDKLSAADGAAEGGEGGDDADSAETSHRTAKSKNMWSKKEAIASHDSYIRGRELAGEAFVEVFATRNAWAVKEYSFGLKKDHGRKLGEALELIVTSSTKPQVLQHKLRVLALSHIQMGLKPEQLAVFGDSLLEFLEQVLDPYDMWDKPTKEAWAWMWDIVHGVFKQDMVAARTMLEHLESSWAAIQEEELGEIIARKFYDHLFAMAPQLQPMFTKPFKMQLVMLTQALDLVVRSVRDTRVLSNELKALAMTHIKYDIHQVHLNIFGEVLIKTLKEVMGPEKWDDEMETAWADIYMHISEVFGQVLTSGRNLVSKALADGDVEELREALQKMPRGRRTSSALEIEVDDTIISPIVWTIRDGQVALTEVLLKDVLAIRGDRENYYYGRAMLWQKHPELIRLLVQKAPTLIAIVLDGHLWTSRFTEDGHRRVNFYIRELYGDPELQENANVYNTTLGIFITKLPMSELVLFAHPVVNFLVELKWDLFAKQQFVMQQAFNFVNLALSTAYLQVGASNPWASFILGVLQLLVGASKVMSYGKNILKQMGSQSGKTLLLVGRPVFLPYSLLDVFIILNVASATMCVILFAYTWHVDPFDWRTAIQGAEAAGARDPVQMNRWADIAAFTTGLLWLQMAEVFKATTKLSALLYAFIAVMADVSRFLLVLGVWTLGFSMMLYWLMVGLNLREGKPLAEASLLDLDQIEGADVGVLIYFVGMSCMGLASINAIMESSWTVRMVFSLCVLSTVVVLLNLLISTMVNTYDMLQRNCDELAVKSRTEMVVRAEERLSRNQRILIFRSLQLGEPLDFENLDRGPAGGVQVNMRTEQMTHPAYAVPDRLERYSGPTAQELPWDPATRQHNTFNVSESSSLAAKRAAAGPIGELTHAIEKLTSQVATIKRHLRISEDDAASEFASQAGSRTNMLPEMSQTSFLNMLNKDTVATEQSIVLGPPAPVVLAGSEVVDAQAEADETSPSYPNRPISLAQLAAHKNVSSLWLLVDGQVYDCTSLVSYHPGGKATLLGEAGKDASEAFHAVHSGPSKTKANAILHSLPVMGRLVINGDGGDADDDVGNMAAPEDDDIIRLLDEPPKDGALAAMTPVDDTNAGDDDFASGHGLESAAAPAVTRTVPKIPVPPASPPPAVASARRPPPPGPLPTFTPRDVELDVDV
eukprot:jgi/Tetstr1/427315/TSEL_017484.t1